MWLIGQVPVSQRHRQPYPRQPSRTRDAIAQLGPSATPHRVAALAGVSLQAAYRALALSPQLADLAAATDSISVLRVIPRTCPGCRQPFTGPPHHVHCTPACKRAAEARRLHQAQLDRGHDRPVQPPETSAHPPPRIRGLPPAPDFSRGLCTTVHPSQRAWWTSGDRDEREAAARMCAGCPVQPECEQWSLSLPLSDPSVYGGLTQAERRKLRREWLEAIARQVRG